MTVGYEQKQRGLEFQLLEFASCQVTWSRRDISCVDLSLFICTMGACEILYPWGLQEKTKRISSHLAINLTQSLEAEGSGKVCGGGVAKGSAHNRAKTVLSLGHLEKSLEWGISHLYSQLTSGNAQHNLGTSLAICLSGPSMAGERLHGSGPGPSPTAALAPCLRPDTGQGRPVGP